METMKGIAVRARLQHLPMSPRKARLVVDLVRGMPVEEAMGQLEHLPNRAARPLAKLIDSAVANAEDQFGLSAEELYVAEIAADEGPRRRGGRFGGRGRFKPEIKRSCHLRVALRELDPEPLTVDAAVATEDEGAEDAQAED